MFLRYYSGKRYDNRHIDLHIYHFTDTCKARKSQSTDGLQS